MSALEDHVVELLADITLQNKQGIFKNEAKENTKKEIERLVRLIAGDRQVEVNYK